MSTVAARERCLRALGMVPLRLRGARAATPVPTTKVAPNAAAAAAAPPAVADNRILRLALQADPVERRDPAIDRMYVALTEAVTRAGLQPVRVCDVATDPAAALLVFGTADVPEAVPATRVLRADPLAVLHGDRARKRRLWERMLALGRGGAG